MVSPSAVKTSKDWASLQRRSVLSTQVAHLLCTADTCSTSCGEVQIIPATHAVNTHQQASSKHDVVVKLPAACQLTYGADSDPALLALIGKVPAELWGARLALQVTA